MTNLFLILVSLFLVFMNAFFVAAEFGIVKLRQTRVAAIQKNYGLRGRMLAYVHKHLDAYLSACQLGITLASLGLGWVGEPAFADLLKPIFKLLQIQSHELIEVISFIAAFSFISFLHIVVGELMPKSIAIRQSEQVSLWTAIPLYSFYWIMFPAIWLLNNCASYLLKIAGLDATHQHEHFHSTAEIKLILGASHLHGELTKDEIDILERTLEFADLKVTEVMRSQEEMVILHLDQPIIDILQHVAETHYSRYPVFDKYKNDIIGIVHVKDLFATLHKEKTINTLQPIIRPVLKVSSRTPALDLLRQFRAGMPHLALIYRGDSLLGFVTLDHLLHILIGRIKDEFHRTRDDWVTKADGTITVRGDCPISSLERALGCEIEMSDEDQTEILTGLILNKLQRLPIEEEQIDFKEFKAVIKKMRGPRIIKINIYPKPKQDNNYFLGE